MPPGVLMPMQLQNYYTTAAISYIKLAPFRNAKNMLAQMGSEGDRTSRSRIRVMYR